MAKSSRSRKKALRVKVSAGNIPPSPGYTFSDPATGIEFLTYKRDDGKVETLANAESVVTAIGYPGTFQELWEMAKTTVIPGSNPPTTYIDPGAEMIRIKVERSDGPQGN